MKRFLRSQNTRSALILVAGFLLGVAAMYFVPSFMPTQTLQTDSAIRQTGKYKLVAPLLVCGVTQPTDLGEYKQLNDSLEKIISQAEKDGKATDVSVYFRGFSGKWVGINENTPYAPASLLKVPLMIAYFKEAETDPSILDKKLTYDGSFDENAQETFKTPYDIKPGVYKVKDLIKAMIVNSDNNATTLLNNNIDPHTLTDVYTDMGLSVPNPDAPTADIISAKSYSYFFRILYNATYLTPDYSEQALELLDGGDFPQGIQGGVPSDVTVAQKFGERSVLTPQGAVIERDLHDCGFVYYGNTSPYLLCVMTKGSDFQDLSSVIQSVSKAVYAEAQNQKK